MTYEFCSGKTRFFMKKLVTSLKASDSMYAYDCERPPMYRCHQEYWGVEGSGYDM